jgi:hypothetical protein
MDLSANKIQANIWTCLIVALSQSSRAAIELIDYNVLKELNLLAPCQRRFPHFTAVFDNHIPKKMLDLYVLKR